MCFFCFRHHTSVLLDLAVDVDSGIAGDLSDALDPTILYLRISNGQLSVQL